jgi:hypothetical protein
MTEHTWVNEFPGKIEVCDKDGILLEMNDKAAEEENNPHLIGTNILDCHPEPALTKLKALLESGQANIYTIEEKSVKKLIYQAPWYRDGEFAGIVELSLEIPWDMPHFVRD